MLENSSGRKEFSWGRAKTLQKMLWRAGSGAAWGSDQSNEKEKEIPSLINKSGEQSLNGGKKINMLNKY